MSIEPSLTGSVRGHLFTVDILIENDHNGRALERLLRLLNSADVKDYRIVSGIELGKTIEAALQAEGEQASSKKATAKTPGAEKQPAAKDKAANKPAPSETEAGAGLSFHDEIERYKANNTLIRMTIVKGKGIRLSLPCRILNFDPASQNVTVYHVDEKKVYLFSLSEIEDLQAR
ncbi:hypothetical protein ACFFK0_02625 [Paenibacillus chartarius]|uniref:Uncharacterized protein n=1 Tax=Paenibacillus chartarius TaxID=747481 RepID=A0ABV6DFE4_9BACL